MKSGRRLSQELSIREIIPHSRFCQCNKKCEGFEDIVREEQRRK